MIIPRIENVLGQFPSRCLYATVSQFPSRFKPRKQLTWSQCQDYLKRPILLLVQLDNLDTVTRQTIKSKLSQQHLSLVTPKTHILRRAVNLSKWSELEEAIIGSTGLLVSRKKPHQLQEALRYLSSQPKVTLLGGVVDGHSFTVEGVKEIVFEMPSQDQLWASMVSIIGAPMAGLTAELEKAPQMLAGLLDQRCKSVETGENQNKLC